MLSSLGNLFGDGHALSILLGVLALIVIAGLAFWIYRLAFAPRLRPPGGARARAPRLGVVDVFGLDGQRQLVIVRRDNVEHLLLLGGPNDIVVEPNIQRNGAKQSSPSEPPVDAPVMTPAPASQPRPAAALRRDPAPRPAPVEALAEPIADTRPRPTSAPRPASEPLKEPPKEAAKEAAKPEPMKLEAARPAPVVEAPKAVVVSEAARPVEPPPVKPVDTGQAKPVEPVVAEPAAKGGVRPVQPPRVGVSVARPSFPPPITPLRPRAASEAAVEPVKPNPPSEVVMLKPAAASAPPPPSPPAEVKAVGDAPQSPARIKKEETFYDLESLEAEMARLLGRDP